MDKKEIIHRYSDRIKEFYSGESANADVDTCKLLAELLTLLPINYILCYSQLFRY